MCSALLCFGLRATDGLAAFLIDWRAERMRGGNEEIMVTKVSGASSAEIAEAQAEAYR